MGKINSAKSVIALGGILGAMGAFDEDGGSWSIDNRYVWRLNCEDGSSYGVDPADLRRGKSTRMALRSGWNAP